MAKLNLEYIRNKMAEVTAKESRSGPKTDAPREQLRLNIPSGTFEFRLLPPWNDAGILAREIWSHYGLAPDNSIEECPQLSFPGMNLRCEVHAVLEEFKDKVNTQRMRATLRPSVNVYIPESPINAANKDVAPHIGHVRVLRLSGGAWNQIIKIIANPSIGDITSPTEGVTLSCTKTTGKEWRDTKYSVVTLPRMGPIVADPAKLEEIIKKTPNLDKLYSPPDDARRARHLEVAAKLRKYLEQMASHPSLSSPTEAPIRSSTPAPEQGKPPINPTTGKPVCFGDGQVYSAVSPVCATCVDEASCVTEVKARKKGK